MRQILQYIILLVLVKVVMVSYSIRLPAGWDGWIAFAGLFLLIILVLIAAHRQRVLREFAGFRAIVLISLFAGVGIFHCFDIDKGYPFVGWKMYGSRMILKSFYAYEATLASGETIAFPFKSILGLTQVRSVLEEHDAMPLEEREASLRHVAQFYNKAARDPIVSIAVYRNYTTLNNPAKRGRFESELEQEIAL